MHEVSRGGRKKVEEERRKGKQKSVPNGQRARLGEVGELLIGKTLFSLIEKGKLQFSIPKFILPMSSCPDCFHVRHWVPR